MRGSRRQFIGWLARGAAAAVASVALPSALGGVAGEQLESKLPELPPLGVDASRAKVCGSIAPCRERPKVGEVLLVSGFDKPSSNGRFRVVKVFSDGGFAVERVI